jgi:transcription initiation factor TFIIB
VVAALDDEVDVATGIELVGVADRLMRIADTEPVGPGTSRMSVAGGPSTRPIGSRTARR